MLGDFLITPFFKIGTTGEEIGDVLTFVVTVVELKVVNGVVVLVAVVAVPPAVVSETFFTSPA